MGKKASFEFYHFQKLIVEKNVNVVLSIQKSKSDKMGFVNELSLNNQYLIIKI